MITDGYKRGVIITRLFYLPPTGVSDGIKNISDFWKNMDISIDFL
jgi:hypothetical protein